MLGGRIGDDYSDMGQNADIVQRGFEHFASTGDVLAEIMAPEFVWDMSHFTGWPEQQTYDGVEGAQTFLRDWTGAWDHWRIEVEEMRETGDQVLAILRQSGQSKATGMPLEMTFAQVFTVRDGRQARMEMYSEVEEAKRAVGLAD
jgi:ketosteroid isomerase-like protein